MVAALPPDLRGIAQNLSASSSEAAAALAKLLEWHQRSLWLQSQEQLELQRQTLEYQTETDRLGELLQQLELPVSTLSLEGREALQSMAGVASELGLATSTEAAILPAWSCLCLEDGKSALLQLKVQQQTALLQRLQASSESKWVQCRGGLSAAADVQSQELAGLANSRAEIQTLQVKQSHYLNVVANTKALLQHNGFKHELRHSSLVSQYQILQELQTEVAGERARLDGYCQLPASRLGAQTVVRQAREALQGVQQRIQSGLAQL
ncbi:MAG: hypothetical protein WDW38_010727 [Sanguina aurantia]